MDLSKVEIVQTDPVPTSRGNRDRPWSVMQPGDSFRVPMPPDGVAAKKLGRALIAKAARLWGKGGYAVRRYDNVFQVWRKK
jgi:hypothetical protein